MSYEIVSKPVAKGVIRRRRIAHHEQLSFAAEITQPMTKTETEIKSTYEKLVELGVRGD